MTIDAALSPRETRVSVQRLDVQHAIAAGATLGVAFLDDTLIRFIVPDETRRRRAGPWFLGIVEQYGLRWGEDDRLLSIGMRWVPSDAFFDAGLPQPAGGTINTSLPTCRFASKSRCA